MILETERLVRLMAQSKFVLETHKEVFSPGGNSNPNTSRCFMVSSEPSGAPVKSRLASSLRAKGFPDIASLTAVTSPSPLTLRIMETFLDLLDQPSPSGYRVSWIWEALAMTELVRMAGWRPALFSKGGR